VLAAKDYVEPLLYVHLAGACSIYLVCVHNTLFTPSALGGAARPYHIWFGRIGLLLGVLGAITGYILTWVVQDGTKNLGFSIGISFGGIGQMIAQFFGYRDILRYRTFKAKIENGEYNTQEELHSLQDSQDKYLTSHITSMMQLFGLACGIPALMRVAEVFDSDILLPILILLAFFLTYFMARPLTEKIKTNLAT